MITQEIFNNATQGHTTNIQPLIKIEKGDTLIGLSTTSLTFDGLFYDPLLLNIPSIKESIDIESRKYKISSVNLNLSNAPYEGNRFSDKFNEIINAEAYIYFKTQNANTLEDCLQVYYGRIRRINQGENTLTLVLEDSSEQKIHKDIPKNIIPDTDFKSKYHNKPYPMVIGKIDRSPCVVSLESTSEYDIDNDGDMDEYEFIKSVIIDKVPMSKINSNKIYIGKHFINSVPLWIHMNDAYLGLHNKTTIDFDIDQTGGIANYTPLVDNTGFDFVALWADDVEIDDDSDETPLEQLAANDTAANQGRVLVQREYAKVEGKSRGLPFENENSIIFKSGVEIGGVFTADEELNTERAWDNNPSSCVQITGTYKGSRKIGNWVFEEDYQYGFLKYHFLPLPSGIEINPDDTNDWQKVIAKVKIVNPETVTVSIANGGDDNYEVTTQLPLVSIFQKDNSWAFVHFNQFPLSPFSEDAASSYIRTAASRFDEDGVNITSGTTFGTNQEEYDSLYGDDEIAPVSDNILGLDSNNYNLGLPYIRMMGVNQSNDTAGYTWWDSEGFSTEVDVRIYSSQVWASAKVDNILDKDFYANIWGRPSERVGVYGIRTNSYIGNEIPTDQDSVIEAIAYIMFRDNENFTLNTWYNNEIDFLNTTINTISQSSKEVKINRFKLGYENNLYHLEFEGIHISEDKDPFEGSIDNVGYILATLAGNSTISLLIEYGDFSEDMLNTFEPLMYPSEVIKHILTEECNYEGSFNEEEFQKVTDFHQGWKYSFTQHKIINSKNLIEDIAKSSKTFPRFKSDGSFGWAITKDTYSEEDIDLTIETLDILSYKFDRTKLEDVKTNVKVDFWKDYAGSNYVYSTNEFGVGDLVIPGGRDGSDIYEYYNLPSDDSDSTLVLESDYIREYYTADQLRNWLLSWHMNQHNLITLTLPLKYLKLEVGDIVDFDNEIANMLLYGERYTPIMELNDDEELERVPLFRNGQEIYPYFMITETNKSLDKVTIKLMQLHKHDMALFDPSFIPEGDGDVVVEPDPPTGDVDNNGNVDIVDLVLLVDYILNDNINAEDEEIFLYNGNINQNFYQNGDPVIDVIDLIMVVNIILED